MEGDLEFLCEGGVLISGPLGEFRIKRESLKKSWKERGDSGLVMTDPTEVVFERAKDWIRERWEEKPFAKVCETENGWFTVRVADQTRFVQALRFVSHQCWWDTKDRSPFDSGR